MSICHPNLQTFSAVCLAYKMQCHNKANLTCFSTYLHLYRHRFVPIITSNIMLTPIMSLMFIQTIQVQHHCNCSTMNELCKRGPLTLVCLMPLKLTMKDKNTMKDMMQKINESAIIIMSMISNII